MSDSLPSLDELRQSPDAVWLWDVARARLVWANPAGVAAFEAASLFDLLDRAFDASEHGLQAMAELQLSLSTGETRSALLEFPSLDKTEGLACDCWLHPLADGRMGVVAKVRAKVTAPVLDEAGLFEDLPVGIFAVDDKGALVFANELARELFDTHKITSLAGLLGGDEAQKFLHRLAKSRMVSTVAAYESRFGQREARLTLRRPKVSAKVFALVAIEDVTERRQLEKRLQPADGVPGVLGPQEKRAFEQLGQTLAAAAAAPPIPKPEVKAESAQIVTLPAAKVVEPPKAEVTVTPPPPSHLAVEIVKVLAEAVKAEAPPQAATPPGKPLATQAISDLPPFLMEALERSDDALAIMQQGKPGYASRKLAGLLGYASSTDLFANAAFWSNLASVPVSGGLLPFTKADGSVVVLHVRRDVMPWKSGRADQFSLQVAAAAPPDLAKVKQAESKPQGETPTPPSDELELRSILDISSDGIITLDKQGRIVSVSAGAEAMFGFRNAELAQQQFSKLFSAEGAVIVKEYLAGLDGEGLASVFNDGREVMGVVKQGGSLPLFLNIGRLEGNKGPAVYCAVVRDITTWKRTEHDLRMAKEEAEESSRHKSEFLARVSHELRTPLNAIIGFSEIMRMGQAGELANDKYRGYLNDIHASGNQLLAMINDLLDLSKIESGRMELDFTSVSLADCFDQAAKLLQEQATRARVLLRRSFPDGLPRVVADQRAMRQVMQNLLSNAIKYTDAGGQVIVSAFVETSGSLVLRLKDTGIGMNSNQLKQALVPFMRVETPGRERQGTGLGLPLTKALVEANRAGFSIASEPGQGTQIDITFPTTRVLAE